MNENSQETVNEICIDYIEMRKEHDTALVTSLCGRSEIYSISSVNFINTNLCWERILWCPYHHRWSKVTICHNSQLDWWNELGPLSLLVIEKPLPIILSLVMEHCDLGRDPEILSVILQPDVKHINLSHNNIDLLGVVKISAYLEGHPPLKFLTFDNNKFNEDNKLPSTHIPPVGNYRLQ